MAIITKIEEQKNKKRVNIFVDDAFFCGLNKETAVIFKLKTGKEIDEKTLIEALFDSEVKSAVDKAASYLGLRMHSKKELFDKLLKKGFEKQVIQKAIEKLEEYNYVDDYLFAKQFVSSNSKYSKKMIEVKLKQKGISSDIILDIFGNEGDDEEFNRCLLAVQKYIRIKKIGTQEANQKMVASLARKGFSFDNIKKASKVALNQNISHDEFLE